MYRLLLYLIITTGTAAANPFFIGRFDGLDAGPTNQSAFAVYWNPAAVAQPGASVHTHLLVVDRQASYDRVAELNNVTPEWAHINAGKNHTGGTGLVPALALRYGFDVGGFDIGLGIASFVERAGVAHWRRNLGAPSEYPGAVDGSQRWSALNAELLIASVAGCLGVGHSDSGLSLGVTPIMNFASLSTISARNPDGSDRVIDDAGRLAEGRMFVDDATDRQLGMVVGLRYDGVDDLVFGLTWQKEVIYQLEGQGRLTLGTAEETVIDARIQLPVAQAVRYGLDWTLSPRWVLRPMTSWVQWSVMERQQALNLTSGDSLMDVPREWMDVWSGRLRVDYVVNDALRLSAGGHYERGATPVRTFEPGSSEADNWELALGGSLQVSSSLRLSSSFTWQEFADMNVTNSVNKPLTNGHYTDRRQYLTVDLEVLL